MAQRIGIVGGTFNPVHIAHLVIADRFAEQMQLDRVLLVPAYRSPFKLGETDGIENSDKHRLAMLELSIAGMPHCSVSTIETDRQGISYTIDTLRALEADYQQHGTSAELFLLIGGDQAAAFTKWRAWQEILTIAQLCMARRPHTIPADVEQAIAYTLTTDERTPQWIHAPLLAISSTEIRDRVRADKSIRHLVPHDVEAYIYHHNLYSTP
jgi:nicotinate-nucleotide adenylyltransferase